MTRAVLIMSVVSVLAALIGIGFLLNHARSEAGVYRRRIAGVMLIALGVILAVYAHALHGWGAA